MEAWALEFFGKGLLSNPSIQNIGVAVVMFLGLRELVRIIANIKRKRNGMDDRDRWKNNYEGISDDISIINGRFGKLEKQMEWLYEAHHVFDEDNIPVWYVRKSLETAIDKLAKSIDAQTNLIQRLCTELELRREIEKGKTHA